MIPNSTHFKVLTLSASAGTKHLISQSRIKRPVGAVALKLMVSRCSWRDEINPMALTTYIRAADTRCLYSDHGEEKRTPIDNAGGPPRIMNQIQYNMKAEICSGQAAKQFLVPAELMIIRDGALVYPSQGAHMGNQVSKG